MRRTLVVYYSLQGRTRRIAQEIADACDADLEELSDRQPRSGVFGMLRSGAEALLGVAPPLRPLMHAPRPDDLVVIGTPIWVWNMSSPVRSFLLSHHAALGRVAFFCTYGSSGQDKVFHDMQGLCGHAPVATLGLSETRCAPGAHRAELARFVGAVKAGRAAAQMHAPVEQQHSTP
jgi:flavodoxin